MFLPLEDFQSPGDASSPLDIKCSFLKQRISKKFFLFWNSIGFYFFMDAYMIQIRMHNTAQYYSTVYQDH